MRYVILIVLNLPIILLALVNIVTQYKLHRVERSRFHFQLLVWVILMILLIGSFPVYNLISNRPALDSSELSVFDILQTTAIIFLIYSVNSLRQKQEYTEKRLRNLHQEVSIRLSKD